METWPKSHCPGSNLELVSECLQGEISPSLVLVARWGDWRWSGCNAMQRLSTPVHVPAQHTLGTDSSPKISTKGLIPLLCKMQRAKSPVLPVRNCLFLAKWLHETAKICFDWKLNHSQLAPGAVEIPTTPQHFRRKIPIVLLWNPPKNTHYCPLSALPMPWWIYIWALHRLKTQHLISPVQAETACLIPLPCIFQHDVVSVINEPQIRIASDFPKPNLDPASPSE